MLVVDADPRISSIPHELEESKILINEQPQMLVRERVGAGPADFDAETPQTDLFGNEVTVTPGSLAAVPIDEDKRQALLPLVHDGSMNDTVLPFLRRNGLAQDAKDGLVYLANAVEQPAGEALTVSMAPSGSNGHSTLHLFREPRPDRRIKPVPLYLSGTLLHSGINALDFGRGESEEETELATDMPIQGSFSEMSRASLISLADILQDKKMSDRFASLLDARLDSLGTDLDVLSRLDPFETGLVEALSPLLPQQIDRLLKIPYHDPFKTMLLMEFGQVILGEHETGLIGQNFSEVAIFPRGAQYPRAGRIDALSVATINGEPPDEQQRKVLANLMRKRYRSVAAIDRAIADELGDATYVIRDWKSYLGDGPTAHKPIDFNVLPMPRHVKQVGEYAPHCDLSIFLANQASDDGNRPVWTEDKFVKAQLVYIFPTRRPVTYDLSILADSKAATFQDVFVPRYQRQKQAAMTTSVKNQIAQDFRYVRAANSIVPTEQGELVTTEFAPFPKNQSRGRTEVFGLTYHDLIEMRRFVDDNKILERVGLKRDGGRKFLVHYDALLDAIERGELAVRGFQPDRGGFIQCISPDHQDEHPSAMVYSDHVKCFSCGMHAAIDPATIPKNFLDWEAAGKKARIVQEKGKMVAHVDLSEVPAAHTQFMDRLTELLGQEFDRHREAQQYLTDARGIDLDLAREHAIGFGSYRVVGKLLADGYALDDLAHYGVVGFSPRAGYRNAFRDYLLELGLSPADVMPVQTFRRREEVDGGKVIKQEDLPTFPYMSIANRLTFPLGFKDMQLNTYGRAIRPDKIKHVKLSTRNTGVPQGLFHPSGLSANPQEVIVCEGVMDALSLQQMGFDHVVAIIGTENDFTMATLAELFHDKDTALAIALDNDKAGREKTESVTEKLRRFGSQNPIYSFTEVFAAEDPVPFSWTDPTTRKPVIKDFNEYWLYKRSQQVGTADIDEGLLAAAGD